MIQLTLGAEANAGRFHYVVAMGMRIIKALHCILWPSALALPALTSCPHNLPSFAAWFEKEWNQLMRQDASCVVLGAIGPLFFLWSWCCRGQFRGRRCFPNEGGLMSTDGDVKDMECFMCKAGQESLGQISPCWQVNCMASAAKLHPPCLHLYGSTSSSTRNSGMQKRWQSRLDDRRREKEVFWVELPTCKADRNGFRKYIETARNTSCAIVWKNGMRLKGMGSERGREDD